MYKKILLISIVIFALIINIVYIKQYINYVPLLFYKYCEKSEQDSSNIALMSDRLYAKHMFNRYCKKSELNTINIVLISDRNYVEHMKIAIYSVIKNKHDNTKLHFFLIGVRLNKPDIKELQRLNNPNKNIKITVLNQKNNIYKIFKFKDENDHVTDTDLLKFAIPNILPKLDKIIYIDCDTLVQDDLKKLYSINIKNVYSAVVEDGLTELKNELNIPKYFNNGVLLLNLSKMRKDNIPYKLIKTRVTNKLNRFVTQDTFNMVLYPKVKFISYTYNCNPLWENIYGNSCKNATIIHWAGYSKPWDPKENCKYKDIYAKYVKEYIERNNINHE